MLRRLFCAIALLLFAAGPVAAEAPTPRTVIEDLHAALLSTMQQGGELGAVGRYEKLDPAIRTSFDLKRMIRVASGSHWAAASAEEQARLAEAFAKQSIAVYASRFASYAGERFEVVGEREGRRGSILVDTKIVKGSGQAVPITYVFVKSGERWSIVNVLLDRSISELAVRRSEYSGILSRGGPAHLAATLDNKTQELLSE